MSLRSGILVTGAGGAAAVTLIRALGRDRRVVAGDIDPFAAGLYLVPTERRVILPRGDAPDFVDRLLDVARTHDVELVIPTVDTELRAVSVARARFAEHGIELLVESVATLDVCLDKLRLMERCADRVRTPRTIAWTGDHDALRPFGRVLAVKPRRGAGGRGFAVLELPRDQTQLRLLPIDGSYVVQEFLPGTEYSIDVLARPDGHVVAAVPRTRDKVDSGIAVAGRTVHDAELIEFGRAVAGCIGATTVVNVQARRADDGRPALLEVNPRFPGTMSLTISAGIDMPHLAVAAALGASLPDELPFAEVATVRHWDEIHVPIEEYPQLPALAEVAS